MFGSRKKRLEEETVNDLIEGYRELLRKYGRLADDWYSTEGIRHAALPHLSDAALSEQRMHSFVAAMASRAAYEELISSPKSFTFGDRRDYATSALVEALGPRLMLEVMPAFPKADPAQTREFLADPQLQSLDRWKLQGGE